MENRLYINIVVSLIQARITINLLSPFSSDCVIGFLLTQKMNYESGHKLDLFLLRENLYPFKYFPSSIAHPLPTHVAVNDISPISCVVKQSKRKEKKNDFRIPVRQTTTH